MLDVSRSLSVGRTEPMGGMTDVRQQAVTGLVPPQQGEAVIREVWPSVAAFPAVAALGEKLTRSVVLAPLAWLMLAPFYFLKVFPLFGVARRYTLTNKRLMVRRGFPPKPQAGHEIGLADIDDVRIAPGSENRFYRAADLEVLSKGQVALKLPGVPEAESFRHAIVNAYKAWVPGKANAPIIPASAKK
jgi:hypothetical protein